VMPEKGNTWRNTRCDALSLKPLPFAIDHCGHIPELHSAVVCSKKGHIDAYFGSAIVLG
jgi:hypothetical protein